MKRRLILAAAALALVACAGSGAASGEFVLTEFDIDVPSTSFQAGTVALPVTNAGEFGHTLVLTGEDGRAIAASETILAGGATELVLDLAPGTYQVSCRIVVQLPDGTIVDHYQAGMVAAFKVTDEG
jgi:uncharacterized cupredoxin-like copper-binding protein